MNKFLSKTEVDGMHVVLSDDGSRRIPVGRSHDAKLQAEAIATMLSEGDMGWHKGRPQLPMIKPVTTHIGHNTNVTRAQQLGVIWGAETLLAELYMAKAVDPDVAVVLNDLLPVDGCSTSELVSNVRRVLSGRPQRVQMDPEAEPHDTVAKEQGILLGAGAIMCVMVREGFVSELLYDAFIAGSESDRATPAEVETTLINAIRSMGLKEIEARPTPPTRTAIINGVKHQICPKAAADILKSFSPDFGGRKITEEDIYALAVQRMQTQRDREMAKLSHTQDQPAYGSYDKFRQGQRKLSPPIPAEQAIGLINGPKD